MAQVIAYEDTPLGDYLKEFDEELEALTDQTQEHNTASKKPASSQSFVVWSKWLFPKWSALFSRDPEILDSQNECCSNIVSTILGSAATLAQYTPQPIGVKEAGSSTTNAHRSLTKALSRTLKKDSRTIAPLAGLAVGLNCLRVHNLTLKKWVATGAGIVAATRLCSSLFRNTKVFWTRNRCQELVISLGHVLDSFNILDRNLARLISNIQEVELISRGYRVAPGALPPISRMGGGFSMPLTMKQFIVARNTHKWMRHLSLYVCKMLISLKDFLPHDSQTSMAIGQVLEVAEEFLGTSTATEASDSLPGDSNISVSSLKDEFELYYRLRRCWLLFETDIALISMHDPNLYTTWSKHFAISLGLAMSKICQIEKEIEAHKQSSYSLNSSAGNDEKDTKKEHGQSKIPIPALNSLSSLLYSIRTIQAKVSLCQSYASNMFENFHSASSTQESDIDVRKLSEYELYKQLFQSMKSDIDMLHEQFDAGSCQLNLEIWPPVSSSRQDVLTASASQPDNAKNDESLNEDDSTLDGPYDQETDEFTLDAPELFFEASVVVKGRTRSSKILPREERIKIMKEKREKENKEREKAKQLFRMMDELQDVVSARKKRPESEEMPSNENAEPNS